MFGQLFRLVLDAVHLEEFLFSLTCLLPESCYNM